MPTLSYGDRCSQANLEFHPSVSRVWGLACRVYLEEQPSPHQWVAAWADGWLMNAWMDGFINVSDMYKESGYALKGRLCTYETHEVK